MFVILTFRKEFIDYNNIEEVKSIGEVNYKVSDLVCGKVLNGSGGPGTDTFSFV